MDCSVPLLHTLRAAVRHGPHDAGPPHRGLRQREGEPLQGEDLVLRGPLEAAADDDEADHDDEASAGTFRLLCRAESMFSCYESHRRAFLHAHHLRCCIHMLMLIRYLSRSTRRDFRCPFCAVCL